MKGPPQVYLNLTCSPTLFLQKTEVIIFITHNVILGIFCA